MADTTHFSKHVRDFLHQHGSRATLARLKIFKELARCDAEYFELEYINQKLLERNEVMASSTVHKTLRQLCLMGLLVDEKTAGGDTRYKKTQLFQCFESTIAG